MSNAGVRVQGTLTKGGPRRPSARVVAWGLGALLATIVLCYHTVSFDFDARQYYSIVDSILSDHDLDTRNQGLLRWYAQFPPGFAFLVAPVAGVIDRMVSPRTLRLEVDDISEMVPESRVPVWQALGTRYTIPAVGGGLVVVRGTYMVAFALVSLSMLAIGLVLCAGMLSPRQSWIPLLLAVGSPMLLYNCTSYLLYASLTALGLSALGLFCYRRQSSHWGFALACGAACGALTAVRYEAVLFLICFVAGNLERRDQRNSLLLAIGWLPFALLILAYNRQVFGNPFALSYEVESLNVFAVSAQRIGWYIWGPRSGLLLYSTLAMLSLVGLWFERDRTYLVLTGILLVVYLLRINPHTDMETAGLDINRYCLVLFPFSVLGLGRVMDQFGRRAVVAAALLAPIGLAMFFTLFPFRDRYQPDQTPFSNRLARDCNFGEPSVRSLISEPSRQVVFAKSIARPRGWDGLREAAIFHKYGGYYGFVLSCRGTFLRGTYFDRGTELVILHLRPCRGLEAGWARDRLGSYARPF